MATLTCVHGLNFLSLTVPGNCPAPHILLWVTGDITDFDDCQAVGILTYGRRFSKGMEECVRAGGVHDLVRSVERPTGWGFSFFSPLLNEESFSLTSPATSPVWTFFVTVACIKHTGMLCLAKRDYQSASLHFSVSESKLLNFLNGFLWCLFAVTGSGMFRKLWPQAVSSDNRFSSLLPRTVRWRAVRSVWRVCDYCLDIHWMEAASVWSTMPSVAMDYNIITTDHWFCLTFLRLRRTALPFSEFLLQTTVSPHSLDGNREGRKLFALEMWAWSK